MYGYNIYGVNPAYPVAEYPVPQPEPSAIVEDDEDEDDGDEQQKQAKKGNVLPLWGNERSMNLNPLILTNIQSSHYFKVNLYELKTYHEVIDEIYYKVAHLEPWEKGSRKTSGQTGMCGGVRGVGAGGIVSTAYCLLYKLFTLRLTRKQVNGLINHTDSAFIRALGFMYIRYTQPPSDLYDWYDEYLDDAEELDVKAGGGQMMTIGDMLRAFLTKLEWFSTLFPRIPVPIQQKNEKLLNERFPPQPPAQRVVQPPQRQVPEEKHPRGASKNNERPNAAHRDRSPIRDQDRSPGSVRERGRDRHRDDSRRGRHETHRPHRDSHRDKNLHRERDREGYGDRPSHRDRGRDREHRHRDDRVRSHYR